MKPIIGIAGYLLTRIDNHLLDFEINQSPRSITESIQKAGGLPMILPQANPIDAERYIDQIDALVLTGGADVDPLLYREEPDLKIGKIDPDRDVFEIALIEEAWRQKKPIFAICRGLQLINVVFGGSLYQDLSQYPNLEVNHVQPTYWDYPTHSIQIEEESWIGRSIGTKAVINSYHHQAIKGLADVFEPVAWAEDRIIEAIESKNKSQKVLGIQWHPEVLAEKYPDSQKIIETFINLVKSDESDF